MAGLIMAFEKYDYKLGMFKSPKIGLDNFTYLFATKDALNITRNTLLYNAVFIILGNILAITVAILLNDVRSKTKKKLYQTLILIPYLISTVIVSYIVLAFKYYICLSMEKFRLQQHHLFRNGGGNRQDIL